MTIVEELKSILRSLRAVSKTVDHLEFRVTEQIRRLEDVEGRPEHERLPRNESPADSP